MLRELVLAIGISLLVLLLAELALDAAHSQDITRAQHPTGQLSAVPAVLLDGQGRHKLLLGAAVMAECHRGWQEDREAPG
jgi:hypothetical protein